MVYFSEISQFLTIKYFGYKIRVFFCIRTYFSLPGEIGSYVFVY